MAGTLFKCTVRVTIAHVAGEGRQHSVSRDARAIRPQTQLRSNEIGDSKIVDLTEVGRMEPQVRHERQLGRFPASVDSLPPAAEEGMMKTRRYERPAPIRSSMQELLQF